MNITIGPYKLSQRTPYSKICVYDMSINKYVSEFANELATDIMDDYNKQMLSPNDFFDIKNDSLIGLKNAVQDEEIEYLFIPEGITTITEEVLQDSYIKFVSLPNTLKEIDNYAFYNYLHLNYIEIPDTVTKIGGYAFGECQDLKYVKLLANIYNIAYGTFAGCISLKNIVLPDTIKSIDDYSFADCTSLENIQLSKNLEILGNFAFGECENLSKIDLPDKLSIIGVNCFSDCKSLKEIIIPDSVKYIDESAFLHCKELQTVKLPSNLIRLNNETFRGCTNLTNIILPDSIEYIGTRVFDGTLKLENINIPRNLNILEAAPFAASNIKTLTFNYNLEDLYGNSSLLYASSIYKLIINKNVTTITPHAIGLEGTQITSLDYLGTEEEFNKFKKNNNKLFDRLPNLKEINFIQNILKTHNIENLSK